ncbi:hypothetical protein LDO26_03780 [Luteimonas sp. BDR2-5]|uniref:hypothetical protein n=1 Tax=Proluteimonas luteida TaxID=2878685 RepID=UPI001E33A3BE|nr:hypothetical protein [Luteimonas sp. BDR2-5]MCD9027334.1 hypothetical protein [Luteimonas sp. BDR2-5]
MTTPHPPSAPGPSSAASAFLRGVERRAALFAQWQCGDIETGDAALANAMADFAGIAPRTAFSEWPRRFWSLLLAAPLLRAPAPLAHGDDGLAALEGLSGGPRVTLLLRLVAGLSEHDAATVLGVSRATYRLGLRRALPHQADGAPDAQAWRALADSVQQAVRELPADRLARLAAMREAAMQGTVPALRRFPVARPQAATPGASTSDVAPPVASPPPRPRWLWPALGAVVLATGAALAATWWTSGPGGDAGDAGIRVEALGAPADPQARYDADIALLTERDFELLLESRAADDAAWREDPAFHAWLAVHLDVPVVADPVDDGDVPTRVDDALETSDAEI